MILRKKLGIVQPATPVEGCMITYANNYDPEANVNEGCVFPDNSDRVLIAETSDYNVQQHGIYIEQCISIGYGSDVSSLIDLTGAGFSFGQQYANDTDFGAFLYSYTGAYQRESTFREIYPETQGFMPLGSDDFVEIPLPTSIPVMITCGAGITENTNGYGMGLEFWDYENVGSGSVQSSLTNGVVAGRIMKIKDERNCSWWESRFCARITADRNLHTHPNGEYWNKYNGFGKINTDAAIAYNGVIPIDPYINNLNTYTPFVP